ncbi:hypothetical protein N7493_009972 [Penicillium malachiteum]|uniref:Uncharacterized protein n=1 Tax=Penicillium malachiteum TaxID=1324776 RepID=A0AAD6HDW4_9EURO|nr:hypothetical protein N7493_009972 [Penicillium malachiteum]
MAYSAVQVEEVASDSESESDLSVSRAFQPLPDVEDFEPSHLELTRANAVTQLAALYRPMTCSSYEVVEADDYDYDDADPFPNPSDDRRIPPLNTAVARHSSPEPPLRSPTSDAPVPLSHPTPDLQAIQGAYAGNVERLEQSAERLSSTTQDIGSEIRKMDQEQKRRQSCSSASNSIIRNGAFSSGPSIARSRSRSTRQRSVSGGSYLTQVAEPDHDDDSEYPPPLPTLPAPQLPIYTSSSDRFYNAYEEAAEVNEPFEIERPDTAASGDTFHQARTLFTDFDGVHFTPLDRADSIRRLSLSQAPLANQSEPYAYKEAQNGEHMVYYPAPVPRMLNLPPKLSRRPPATEREKRRTQILNSIAAEDRKLAEQEESGRRKEPHQSAHPPQLRASVFFDQPSTSIELEVKEDSVVATLDSILDASASAPVSAFTDHPYAGHVGSYVYGKKRNTKNKLQKKSQSSMGQSHSKTIDAASQGSVHSDDLHHDESERLHDSYDPEGSVHSDAEDEELSPASGEEEDEADYVGPPNTLLAELELRKQELQQRRRTFVPQHTEGMKATLLELDEMAQKQSEKRRRRPVTLAWDNRHAGDDDDVPLALLYPDQKIGDDPNRPHGLMERREMEENEPLSARRARLRGEPVPEKRSVTVHAAEVASTETPTDKEEPDDEGETLAERLRRLRGQNPADSEFSNDLLAEFDTRFGSSKAESTTQSSQPPQPAAEETLAQRRARLQKEQKEQGVQSGIAKNPRTRQSMAALPQVRPTQVPRSKSSYDILQQPSLMQQNAHRMSMQAFPNTMGYQGAGYPTPQFQPPPPYTQGSIYPPPYAYNHMHNPAFPPTCGPTIRQPIQPAQREVIDRWRQSIR